MEEFRNKLTRGCQNKSQTIDMVQEKLNGKIESRVPNYFLKK